MLVYLVRPSQKENDLKQCDCIFCTTARDIDVKKKAAKAETDGKSGSGLVSKQDVLDSINERLEEIKNEFTGIMVRGECVPDYLSIEYNTLVENAKNLISELNAEVLEQQLRQQLQEDLQEGLNRKAMKPTPSFKRRVLDAIATGIPKQSTVGDLYLKGKSEVLWNLYNEISTWKE